MDASPFQWSEAPHHHESIEELWHKVTCAISELEATKEANKLEEKLAEAELEYLQDLLEAARKERDEAVEQYQSLKMYLFQISNSMIGSPTAESSRTATEASLLCHRSAGSNYSQHFPSRPCENLTNGCKGIEAYCRSPSSITSPASFPFHDHYKMQIIHKDISGDADQSMRTAIESLSMDNNNNTLQCFLEEDKSLNSMTTTTNTLQDCKQMQKPHSIVTMRPTKKHCKHLEKHQVSNNVSTCSWGSAGLQRQSSVMSTAASRSQGCSDSNTMPSSDVTCEDLQPSPFMPSSSEEEEEEHVAAGAFSFPAVAPSNKFMAADSSSYLSSSTMVSSQPYAKCSSTTMLPQKRQASDVNRLDSLVTSLPEKGELLEAVAKAGPLLQQLLIIGALPEWNIPPPMMDIPMVPL